MQIAATAVDRAYDERGRGRVEALEHPVSGHFEAGPRYRTQRHGRPDLLLLVTLEGAGVLREPGRSGRRAELCPGTAALYRPGAAQDYGTEPGAGRWRFRWAHAVPEARWSGWLRWPGPWPGVGVIDLSDAAEAQRVAHALDEAAYLGTRPIPAWRAMTVNAVEAALLRCAAAAGEADHDLPAAIRRGMDAARKALHRRVGVAEMADAACLSPSRFSAVFRAATGESPAAFAERLRLEHARGLLRVGAMSVGQAAEASGFHDASHFSRRFRRAFGVSPSSVLAPGGG